MIDKSRIIAFDFQGWPIMKMNIREMLEGFGAEFNKETNKWEIEESSVLDIYPRRLVDDGMGYGVHEEAIVSVNVDLEHGEPYCNIFTEKEVPHIDIWIEDNLQPYESVKYGKANYYVTEVVKNDKNEFVYKLKARDKKTKNQEMILHRHELKKLIEQNNN